MIRKITVLSRFNFIKHWPTIGTGNKAISIYGTDQEAVFPKDSRVLGYQFDDCSPSSCLMLPQYQSITTYQARDIVELIEHFHIDLEEDINLVVHCAAGVSRSGAVGRFASVFCDIEADFFADNAQVIPNNWVYNLLLQVWKEYTEE